MRPQKIPVETGLATNNGIFPPRQPRLYGKY